jgi:putative ABC transport system ATP-binding protein
VPEAYLRLDDVNVVYGTNVRVNALADVSVSFEPGTLTLIVGPSGSGKTTLLSVLGCLLRPDSGSVHVAGEEVSQLNEAERTSLRSRHIGFVFQAFRLFKSLSALENVKIAGNISGVAENASRSAQLLNELGLGAKMQMKPNELSGGEKQRVAIARALVKSPEILLADEPTGALDSAAGEQIMKILTRSGRESGKTVVVVTHDTRWQKFADRVVTLRDGRVTEVKRQIA